MEKHVSVLKPFEDVTRMMSASRYATISMVIPILNILAEQMKSTEMNDLGKEVCKNISSRWPNYQTNQDYAVPAYLDPRFKDFAFTDEHAKAKAGNEIISLLVHNHNDKQGQKQTPNPSTSANTSDVDTSTKPADMAASTSDCWSIFNRMVIKKTEKETNRNEQPVKGSMELEFSMYRSEQLLDPKMSPYDWWNCNSEKYPNVTGLARVYLPIPATTVPSEFFFSKAGFIISQRRTRLEPDMAEKLVCLSHNVRKF